MHTVDLPDDVFYYIRGRADEANLSIADLIRSALGPKIQAQTPDPTDLLMTTLSASGPLKAWLSEPQFQSENTSIGKYMFLIERLYRSHPTDFEKLCSIRGRGRQYIGKSAAELDATGNSMQPWPISDSGYWATSNLANKLKRKVLRDGMKLLGYGLDDIELVTSTIPV